MGSFAILLAILHTGTNANLEVDAEETKKNPLSKAKPNRRVFGA